MGIPENPVSAPLVVVAAAATAFRDEELGPKPIWVPVSSPAAFPESKRSR